MTAATPANLGQRLRELREAVHQSIDVRGEGEHDVLNDHELAFWEFVLDEADNIADALAAKDAIIEKARVALGPFAAAVDNLEADTRDTSEIWESPAAMSITAGDLRRAADALKAMDNKP